MIAILLALSAAQRTLVMILVLAMLVGFRSEVWAVISRKAGWKASLSTAVFSTVGLGGAVICLGNIFPDLGINIPAYLRLALVNLGLFIFLVGLIAGLHRRALRVGPDKGRAALLSGLSLLLPFAVLLTLLITRGANG